ncbi:oxidoreductase C-terminal domain-containing protein [Caballeronia sp. Lep1P3]|uniref:oxidoreductase C-terminal domain-containing protein n=1 Tax=Caballeronia sp. Lep1P3 TaxID=2878150 RepID=UPI001FD169D5|nr:oxidoreductase C-terminal domain-containing protein [Caballeronia sp. Lep1P3]
MSAIQHKVARVDDLPGDRGTRVAAFNMAGIAREYAGVPFFWTLHYDKTFEYLGHADEFDRVEIDGDLDAQAFIAYTTKGDALRAVMSCERSAATSRLAEATREPLTLDAARRMANG